MTPDLMFTIINKLDFLCLFVITHDHMNDTEMLQFDHLCKIMADSMQIGFISFDKSLTVIDYTPSVKKLVYLGSSIDEILEKGTDTHIWKNWKDIFNSMLAAVHKVEIGTLKYTFQNTIRVLNITGVPIPHADSHDVIGGILVLSDITDKLDIEHELAQAERLVAIGKVAGKVAHELNNPLDGILRYVNLALRTIETGQTDKSAEYLMHCRTGLQRMAQIITELLDFSRNTHLAFETNSIDKLLEDAIRSMESKLRNINVEFIRNHRDPIPHVKSDVVFQVFSNLIKNAADAMAGNGQLTITLTQSDDDWQITFLDTGPGFDPKHIDDLFKPFFTTKPKGLGTGLGLSICKDILAKLGGWITAENAPQGGGLFTIHLPMSTPHSGTR